MIPDYNRVAWCYDLLARLVFGKAPEKAKGMFLNRIRPNDRVLIVGGGTGNDLILLDRLNMALEVDFIEYSGKMLDKARSKRIANLKVTFHQTDILNFRQAAYDAVLVNFFLDQYDRPHNETILKHLIHLMKNGANLYYVDYLPPVSVWNKFIMWLMHRFFRITINLDKIQIYDCRSQILSMNFDRIESEKITSMIISEVYKIS